MATAQAILAQDHNHPSNSGARDRRNEVCLSQTSVHYHPRPGILIAPCSHHFRTAIDFDIASATGGLALLYEIILPISLPSSSSPRSSSYFAMAPKKESTRRASAAATPAAAPRAAPPAASHRTGPWPGIDLTEEVPRATQTSPRSPRPPRTTPASSHPVLPPPPAVDRARLVHHCGADHTTTSATTSTGWSKRSSPPRHRRPRGRPHPLRVSRRTWPWRTLGLRRASA